MNHALRVLLVAENVSARFGGESFLPLHYFRVLRARGVDTYLVTHERVRAEVEALFPNDLERLYFVEETLAQAVFWNAGHRALAPLSDVAMDAVIGMMSQRDLRKLATELVPRLGIHVVHQPNPVSPRIPSSMFGLGAPVVIGPMNGGIEYPPAFRKAQGHGRYYVQRSLRTASEVLHRVMPGKREAAMLLVANERTRKALPSSARCRPARQLVENGVDLSRFQMDRGPRQPGPARFAFVGRLVDWKAVDVLLEALAGLADPPVELDIFGDGPECGVLVRQVTKLSLAKRVRLHGFLPQQEVAARLSECDGLVLPSLRECGGAVVLEAMAKGLPVIATRWGGPADYLDESCGILVEPSSRDSLVRGLRAGMARLAKDPELRRRMGDAGRAKVEREFDWERKVDQILDIYRDVVGAPAFE